MKIQYISQNFRQKKLDTIEQANQIIEEYQVQGYELTLRQLYYQFVSRGLIPNTPKSYSSLGKTISDGRLAGLIDWEAIVDRTRRLNQLSHFSSVAQILRAARSQYRVDKWENQEYLVQVWIEKDALIGVISDVCNRWDVPYIAVRGYNSQSVMWNAGQTFNEAIDRDQQPVVLHLGDHDPSGIDMTRDNKDRLDMFTNYGIEVDRLALNYDQVEQYNPPPNPTKLSDSRATSYIFKYGQSSWELDALEPSVIANLVEENILELLDRSQWNKDVMDEEEGKDQIGKYIKEAN